VTRSPAAIVAAYNDAINERDIDALARLMTDDHAFVDKAGARVAGKGVCLNAWRRFFVMFPVYQNETSAVSIDNDIVVLTGRSLYSDDRLAGPALWTATLSGVQVREWRVLEDTPANRAAIGAGD
jgi:ketosteroid isomerase-like protein